MIFGKGDVLNKIKVTLRSCRNIISHNRSCNERRVIKLQCKELTQVIIVQYMIVINVVMELLI
jgi:hypothetical protein